MAKPALIIQPGYSTGDQFGIAAKLVNDRNASVLVCQHPEKKSSYAIEDFYLETLQPNQVMTLEVPLKDYYNTKALERLAREAHGDKYSYADLGAGTKFVAGQWSEKAQNNMRKAWKLTGASPEVQEWLDTQGLTAEAINGKKVAVIWSRFSGKKGGAHPEHDTSHEGVRQMVDALKQDFDTIVIVGDRHPNHPKPTSAEERQHDPWSQLQERNPGPKGKVVDLTEFWRGDEDALARWCRNTRTGQFRLYDHLHAQSQGLVHLGFRSGNLEAMALMGHKVGYMEQKHSSGGPRMDAWQKAKPKGLNYDKILLDQVPTRTGRKLVAEGVKDVIKSSKQAPYVQHELPQKLPSFPGSDGHAESKQNAGIYEFEKGFTGTDLDSIASFARASVLETALQKLAKDHRLPEDALLKVTFQRGVPKPTLPPHLPDDSLEMTRRKADALAMLEGLQSGLLAQLHAQAENVNSQIVAATKLKNSPLMLHQQEITQAFTELGNCGTRMQKLEKEKSQLQKELGPDSQLDPVEIEKKQAELGKVMDTLREEDATKAHLQSTLVQMRQGLLSNLAGSRDLEQTRNLPVALTQADLDWALQARKDKMNELITKIENLQQALQHTQEQKAALVQQLPRPLPPAPPPPSVGAEAKLAKREVKPLDEQLKEMRHQIRDRSSQKKQEVSLHSAL